ncbi:hypothetical protein NFA_55220 [Nocardia farcinica IFM 10152]|uniref:Uncharacterized protein n=1 Tax=Nocardia farcinica (strain IFM 10152) TaxID=247156 RepID=Q5YN67_NOCFA|nr:hypothetical protein NFA_55220 [Nocardia farcinica IFM 10152]
MPAITSAAATASRIHPNAGWSTSASTTPRTRATIAEPKHAEPKNMETSPVPNPL